MLGPIEAIGTSGKALGILKDLPLWLLTATTLVPVIFLVVPEFSASASPEIRTWVRLAAVAFGILSVCRFGSVLIPYIAAQRQIEAARRVLRFVPLHHKCWWHLAKQKDDSYISQIHMEIQASNTSDQPIQIVKVRLLRPSAKLLHAHALLPMAGSPYYSHGHSLPPKGTEAAAVDISVRGALATAGRPIRVTLGITDQYGEEYKLAKLTVETHDPPMRKSPLVARAQAVCLVWLRRIMRTKELQEPVMPWAFDAGSESINTAASILSEEKRSYFACGRDKGGLGSLNVGLQSTPNHGWTETGKIPQILWERGQGKAVTSPNLELLLRMHNALSSEDKGNLECYLLTQLSKESPFAEVAYFVCLGLHRMNRTIDALKTARTFLAGDRVYAYSNLLGTLSAVVSHEHGDISPQLYPLILNALAGDEEPNFGLREKINLASIKLLNQAT